MDGSKVSTDEGINGSAAALDVDRAILELRRGRAIAIDDGERTLVVAALEAADEALLGQLLAKSSQTTLLVTAERAQAAGLNSSVLGPVAIAAGSAGNLAALRTYGGLSEPAEMLDAGLSIGTWRGSKPLIAGGFKLAKSARLVPALLGYETGALNDSSVIRVSLAAIRELSDPLSRRLRTISESRLPLADAEHARITLFRDAHSNAEHIAIVIGHPDTAAAVPVRLHSACLTGDVLGSLRCDCGEQLRMALLQLAELGAGVLLYLDQEGRGIGLANKLRAYAIQDSGLDTLDADRQLGFSADERTYDVAALMLQQLGITRVQLMTNNPQKISALREHGIEIAGRLPLQGSMNVHNECYLRAKRERAGHFADINPGESRQ